MKIYILLLLFVIINAQVWESSFTAGNYDYDNNFMGGSEVLHLVTHKDKIFASISYWQDESNIWYGGTNSTIGWSQIISLDSPNSSWFVDLNLDSYYLRPEILKEIASFLIITSNLESSFLVSFFESFSPGMTLLLKITAAAITGPAKGPLPASSTPATYI